MAAKALPCPTSQNPDTGKESVPNRFKVQLFDRVEFEGLAVTDLAILNIVPCRLVAVPFLSAPLAALWDGMLSPKFGGLLQS